MKSMASRLRPLAAILFVAILVASGTAVSDLPAEAAGPGAGWPHQRTITVNAATPSANFQIRVQLTNLTNMAANGNDLRFYDSSGVQADYWIEYWNTTPVGQATVWVEVPTAGTTSLTMHYGNAGAAAASNGDNTFIAFDDFSGTSVNSTKWDKKDVDNSISVADGSVTLTSGPSAKQGDQIIYKTPFTVSSGVIVESVMSSNVSCVCAGRMSLSGASTLSGTGAYFSADWPGAPPPSYSYAVWSGGRNGVVGYAAFHDGDGPGSNAPVYVVSIGLSGTWNVSGNVFGTAFEAGRVEYYWNYASSGSSTANAFGGSTAMYPVLANFWEGSCGGTTSFSINTLRVRKFLAGYNPTVTVGAATLTVNKLADTNDGVCNSDCSLREAIATAAAGDTIVFDSTLSGGTITLGSTLTLSKNVTIDGSGLATAITVSGNDAVRVFEVSGGVSATLNGLTIKDGRGIRGAGILNSGTLTVNSCTFIGCSETGGGDTNGGGGIYSATGSILAVTGSTFAYNTSGKGAAIRFQGSTLTVTKSAFSYNTAGNGGAIYIGAGTSMTVENSTFYHNGGWSTGGYGGAIYFVNLNNTLYVTNSTFANNSAVTSGAAFYTFNGWVRLRNTIVAHSSGSGNCGCPGSLCVTNGGNNIDSGTTCGWSSNSGSKSNTDPKLGGFTGTPGYLPLQAGSPAIDGVTYNSPNGAPSTDQRGVARPQGLRYDIGAYEYELLDSTPPTASPTQSPPANGPGWNKADVTVTWNWADNSGGAGIDPANCTTSSVSSGEGNPLTLIGTCKDLAGNTGGASYTLKVDKTAPTISGSHLPAPNAAGWSNTNVTVHFTCSDVLSGLAAGNPPADTVLTGEGAYLSAMGTCYDVAGNSVSNTQAGIKIDRTPPNTILSAPSGWNNVAVTLTLIPYDSMSGVVATYYKVDGGTTQAGTAITISTEGIHTFEYWSEDAAGNAETHRTAEVKIDLTSPTITHTQDPEANAYGWNNDNVTVTFVCADNLSGIASCTSPQTVTTEGKLQTVTGTAVDNATNTASDPATVSVDKTAPTISAAPDRAPNANGWYKDDVLVSFTCADGLSGIASCSPAQTHGEGADQSATGTATDAADNSDSTTLEHINVDKSAPTVDLAAPSDGGTYHLGLTVNAGFSCQDGAGGSGLDSCVGTVADGSPIDTSSLGEHTFTITALDRADNEWTVLRTYTVVNEPPEVAANNAAVSADEGSPATNIGTFSDPDASDTVAMAASSGTVSQVDGTGTWNWSIDTTDGPSGPTTVTITATDDHGAATTTTFAYSVANVAPTASFDVPTEVNEGDGIALALSSASDPSNDDTTAGFEFAFDCGSGYGAFSGDNTATCPTTDNGTRHVKGTVRDKDGGVREYSATVDIRNVAPSAVFDVYPVNQGNNLQLVLNNPTDPSSADTTAGFAYAFDCGDGNGYNAFATAATRSCPTVAAGQRTVKGKLKDINNDFSEYTAEVTVNNVAPMVDAPRMELEPSDEGAEAVASASFFDQASDAPFTCTVNYGDGSGPQIGTIDGMNCIGPAHAYADNGEYTVRVIVTDSAAADGSGQTNHIVANVAPTATLNAPLSVNEGDPIAFSLTGPSDPSSVDTAAGFSYAFSCGETYSAFSASSSASCATNDNGPRTVKGKVKDKDGDVTEYTAEVSVANVAPGATFQVSATVNQGSSIDLSLSEPADASTVDTTAGFEYAFDCGDGNSYGDWGSATSRSCPTDDAGTRNVGGKIRDKDGGESEYTAQASILNTAPMVDTPELVPEPSDEGAGAVVSATFSDQASDTPFGCTVDYGEGSGPQAGTVSGMTCTGASHVYADNGKYTVQVTVKDKHDAEGTASTTHEVRNVAPTASFDAPAAVNEGSAIAISLIDQTDPGAEDTTAGFLYAFDCGDGAGFSTYGSDNAANCATDDNRNRTVQGKIKDQDGDETVYTADVAVTSVAPTATFDAPAAVDEGGAIALSLTGTTDPSGADTAAGFQYAFDCGDGAGYGAWAAASSTSCGTDDNGSRTVKGKAMDKDLVETEYMAEVAVDNVAPTATFGAPATVNEGDPISLAFAGAADVSAADTLAGFAYAFDCGGGYGAYGTVNTFTCTTTDSGSRTVKGMIKDKDGGEREYSAVVTISNVSPMATFNTPTAVNEGEAIELSLSDPTDPSSVDAAAPFAYAFDCGTGYVENGSTATVSCATTDNGTRPVKGKIRDKDGGEREYMADVLVDNVAPGATFDVSGTVDQGSSIELALTDPTDPSSVDTTTGFSYAFDCDDGDDYGEWGTSTSRSCPTDDTGSRTVRGKIRDKDEGESEYTVLVTVNNIAPMVEAPVVAPEPSDEGSGTVVSASFSDIATDAPFSCSVDYGDGSGAQAGTVSGMACTGPSHTYADNGSYTVAVSVTDKNSGTGTTSTTHTVRNVTPTATLGNGGAVDEGSAGSVSFTGQADPSGPDTSAGFHYAYDFDHDGTFDSGDGTYGGSLTAASAAVPASYLDDGPGSRTVRARIIDKDGDFSDYTTTITVINVAPSATFQVPSGLPEGVAIALALSGVTDPSGPDMSAGFQYAFNCGNGFGPYGASSTANCLPGEDDDDHGGCHHRHHHHGHAGDTLTVKAKVKDKDGGEREYTATVTFSERKEACRMRPTIHGTHRNETINGTPGDDIINGNGGSDTINGNGGNDIVCGGSGNDTITTLAGNDVIDGGGGNDTINAGAGNNIVRGGHGFGCGGGGGNDIIATGDGHDLVFGGSGNDVVNAGGGNNTVVGGNGRDTITTGDGLDIVSGGGGNDTFQVGAGDNIVTAGNGNDKITAGDGNDTVTAGGGSDEINVGAGTNKVTAGNGSDKITAGDGDDTVTGGGGSDIIDVGGGVNTVTAGNGNDKLVSTTCLAPVNAGGGDNTLVLGDGNCEIAAGNGDDNITRGNGDGTIDAGGGNNTIVAGTGLHPIQCGNGRDNVTDGDTGNSINVAGGNNTVRAGGGNDVITAGNGNDWIDGGAGTDTCYPGRGNNTVTGCELP